MDIKPSWYSEVYANMGVLCGVQQKVDYGDMDMEREDETLGNQMK